MDLSATQHHQLHHHFPHQEMRGSSDDHSDSRSLDTVNPSPNPTQDQKKPRPPDGEPQKCPRCDSTNTKFCYFNNYSLTQPRYFCKACRRYWTKGGTLRNVPVGGGCRKSSKRSSSSSPSLSPSHFIKRPHSQDTSVPATGPIPNPIFSNLSLHAYSGGLGLGLDSWQHQLDQPMSTRTLPDMSFLQQFQYGNGLLFPSYEQEAAGGNSNCASGISEDIAAAMGPYDDVLSSGQAVKEERDETGGMWGLPWQINGDHSSLMAGGGGGGGDLEPIRDNWNGLIGNSAWGILNTPALM